MMKKCEDKKYYIVKVNENLCICTKENCADKTCPRKFGIIRYINKNQSK